MKTDFDAPMIWIAVVLSLAIGVPARAANQTSKLAPIQVTSRQRQLIGLTLATVQEKEVVGHIETTGLVQPDEQLEYYVQTRFAGWIRQVFVNQTYQYVKRGQPLFTIYSPDLVSSENEYLLALKTTRQLSDSPVKGVAEGAKSLVDAALARLRLFGVPPWEIARLKRERTVRDTLTIDSPATGYVVERNALPNMYAQPQTKLYAISNLSTVWAYAAVFQNQIGEIKVGTPVTVTVDTYPGKTFQGNVDFIWQAIDPITRTAKVRCAFSNPENLLKLGMFVRIALKPKLGRALVIPDTGVFQTGTHNIVFIDQGDGYLRPVEVELGAHAGHEFIVRKGLRSGERIVSSANFLIDSESQLQAAVGTFAPPPPGASATANAPSGTISLSTKPSPPHKGSNQVLITVHDSTGRIVSDANVSVIFYMPAMPAMGMSAMRVQASAKPVGNGTYAATVKLASGGNWNVTALASRAGKRIAGKQLTISVPGGM